MINIDGSFGEGGGQILRTSLCLSLVTGKPFKISNIRAGRKKPGLLRQHLTAVNAAKTIGNADVNGNNIGSTELLFQPADIIPGEYNFQVGTAGSSTLVLQTILPALMFAKSKSILTLEGGTHNPFAPPYDFLECSYLPCLKKMGVNTLAELIQYGFYPAGGGKFVIEINPVEKLNPINLIERGTEEKIEVIGFVSQIPFKIAEKEVGIILSEMNWNVISGKALNVNSPGPGNIVYAKLEYKNICEVFTGFGRKGIPLKRVAESVIKQVKKYLESKAPVGEYLSDQLLIPFALAGKGRFRTNILSKHAKTNIEIIKKFLDTQIEYNKINDFTWEIDIRGEPYEMD